MEEEYKPTMHFVEPGAAIDAEPETNPAVLAELKPVPPGIVDETKKVTDAFTAAMVRYIRTITDASTGAERTLSQLLRMVEMKFAEVKVFATLEGQDAVEVTRDFSEAVREGVRNAIAILVTAAPGGVSDDLNIKLEDNNSATVGAISVVAGKFREAAYIRESMNPWWQTVNQGLSILWDYMLLFVELGRAAGVSDDDVRMVLTGINHTYSDWNEYVQEDRVTVNDHGLDIARKVSTKFNEFVAAGLPGPAAVQASIQWAAGLAVEVKPDGVETPVEDNTPAGV